MIYRFDLNPVAKPRQTRADVWKKRPCVCRYRAFADELRLLARQQHFTLPDAGFHVTFYIQTSKQIRWDKPHQQRPDLDNCLKALIDALRPEEDCAIYYFSASKFWAEKGAIVIQVY